MKAECGVCDGARCACTPGANGLEPATIQCQVCHAVRARGGAAAVRAHRADHGRTQTFQFPVAMSERGPTIVATDYAGRFLTDDTDEPGFNPDCPVARVELDDHRRALQAYRTDQRYEAQRRLIASVMHSINSNQRPQRGDKEIMVSQPSTFAERMTAAIQRAGGRADNSFDVQVARHHVEQEVAAEIAAAMTQVCRERGKDPRAYAEKLVALEILHQTRPDLMALQRELRQRRGARETR